MKVFNEIYPEYKGKFIQLIDRTVRYHENLIDHFTQKEDMPQIAVSVDMLDTGIDIPEVVNLVFFKPVKSKVKFWQMIGRGTRLCPNLFGVGKDKKQFYIFDYCRNFEFFDEKEKGAELTKQMSLTEILFSDKLDLIVELQAPEYKEKRFQQYRQELVDEFLTQLRNLREDKFYIKARRKEIEIYKDQKNWKYLSILDQETIRECLLPILIKSQEEEATKRWDHLLFQYQSKLIKKEDTKKEERGVLHFVHELEQLKRVSQVTQKQEILTAIGQREYLKRADFLLIEKIRKELREIIPFIEEQRRSIVETDFEDKLLPILEGESNLSQSSFINYKDKLQTYIKDHQEEPIFQKIRKNIRISGQEKEQLDRMLEKEIGRSYEEVLENLTIQEVIRNTVGMDKRTIQEIFEPELNRKLEENQIKFIKLLMDYLIENGTIEIEQLLEDPFRSLGEISAVFSNHRDCLENLVLELKKLRENARELA